MTHPPPPRQRLQEVDFRRHHTVRWQEVDALGQVDVPSYIRMMEETEYAFLRSLNLSIVMQDERGIVGFPRVTAAVEIQNAARLGDALEIWLQVVCNDGVKIGYRFEITRLGQVVADGEFLLACCRFPPNAAPRAILVPDFFLERFSTGISRADSDTHPPRQSQHP